MGFKINDAATRAAHDRSNREAAEVRRQAEQQRISQAAALQARRAAQRRANRGQG